MKVLGNIKPPAFVKFKRCTDDYWFTEEKDMSLGEVYSFGMSENQTQNIFKDFFTLINDSGYCLTDDTQYDSLSLTACRGSVEPHEDPKYGLVALWLVRLTKLNKRDHLKWGDVPFLYSEKKWTTVQLGDVVVFNANKEHAWLINGACHMLMQTVTKKRIRR